ncbi:hypothetical protein [Epilithonimonas sp. UC225_85]|uniref:hypothetical protein n=1 Tax=Epilithonimonas sp. UC225_85 TaxID=3350167 RepID=UPI0036D425AF
MILIDEIFSDACQMLGWTFIQGDDHWNNVKDIENNDDNQHGKDDTDLEFSEKKKYFFLLSKKMRNKRNTYGAVESRLWSGEIVLGVRSNLTDPTYEYKLLHQINPLYAEQERMEVHIPDCEGMKINVWDVSEEVADAYDSNFDGLRITFEIQHDEI